VISVTCFLWSDNYRQHSYLSVVHVAVIDVPDIDVALWNFLVAVAGRAPDVKFSDPPTSVGVDQLDWSVGRILLQFGNEVANGRMKKSFE
jgi:hypothetical protein